MSLNLARSISLIAVLALAASCHKQVAHVNTPPPPPPSPKSVPPVAPQAVAQQQTPQQSGAKTPDAATKASIQSLLDRIQDVYFDYDKHALRPDAQSALEADAQSLRLILQQYPTYQLTVEGFCDERGSEEYNLALGNSRAVKAEEFLVSLGIPSSQLRVLSFGKEKPVCTEHTEACWQRNRRAHITQDQHPS